MLAVNEGPSHFTQRQKDDSDNDSCLIVPGGILWLSCAEKIDRSMPLSEIMDLALTAQVKPNDEL
jgi:hypothetical protein